jgi:hypothetical protein
MKRFACVVPAVVVISACAAGAPTRSVPNAPPEARVASSEASAESEPIETTALSDGACRAAALCGQSGLCSARGDECIATSDAECHSSSQCTTDGACTAVDGACVAASDSECRQSEACRRDRRCSAHQGYCVR